jgi:non-ribosomal peptide synthetase component F
VTAKFDLTLSMAEGDGELGGQFEYKRTCSRRRTMERLGASLRDIADGHGGGAGAALSEIEMLTAAERAAVAGGVERDSGSNTLQVETIHQLFDGPGSHAHREHGA